jgi:hypothetical protein
MLDAKWAQDLGANWTEPLTSGRTLQPDFLEIGLQKSRGWTPEIRHFLD